MANAQERKQALIEHKVITDVLPGELDLHYDLTVKWPSTTLNKAGDLLDREETQSEPTIHLNPTVRQEALTPQLAARQCLTHNAQPSEPLKNLVLIVTDPVSHEIRSTYTCLFHAHA
jgi:hypothetical protein